MRMSDWSSDVCSSDLSGRRYRWPMPAPARAPRPEPTWAGGGASARERRSLDEPFRPTHPKFGVRMSDDLEGGMEKKQRDNSGADELRPGADRPDYQKCCDDHREVGHRLVAAEQPALPHGRVHTAETRVDEPIRPTH